MELFELFNPIFLIFASYTIGVLGTGILKLFGIYDWFENHNYISDNLTRKLGVTKTFNQKLKFKGRLNKEKLEQLKTDMTFAENNHLVAFILLQILIVLLLILGIEFWHIIAYSILNVVFNLYLVFLQQYNKRRIDRILEKCPLVKKLN